jgi:hypothetical protein
MGNSLSSSNEIQHCHWCDDYGERKCPTRVNKASRLRERVVTEEESETYLGHYPSQSRRPKLLVQHLQEESGCLEIQVKAWAVLPARIH